MSPEGCLVESYPTSGSVALLNISSTLLYKETNIFRVTIASSKLERERERILKVEEEREWE